MVSPKKNQRADLEKIAAQLASVRVLVVPKNEQLVLRASAKFTTRSFDAGAYKVSVGLRQALLHLDHPSYEIENAYQATLPKETWSESWKNSRKVNVSGEARLKFGANLFGLFSGAAKGHAEKVKNESAEQKASAPYRMVSASPMGWQIGTELGDPRDPEGTLPSGLEHCLNGEYLSGRNGEHGEGCKEKDGSFALCELRLNLGGNDPRIIATLFGVSGSLQIAVTSSDPPALSLKTQNEKTVREETLRKAFVDICLQRAEAAHQDGARTDAMLSGEFYLSHHEVHAPKGSPRDLESSINLTDKSAERDARTESRARTNAKHPKA